MKTLNVPYHISSKKLTNLFYQSERINIRELFIITFQQFVFKLVLHVPFFWRGGKGGSWRGLLFSFLIVNKK